MTRHLSLRARLALSAGLSVAAFLPSTPAFGAPYDPTSLVERTCRNAEVGRHPADRGRMAALLLADAGVIDEHPEQWITQAFALLDVRGSHPTAEQRAAIDAVRQIQETLRNLDAAGAARFGLEAVPVRADVRTEFFWLLREDVQLSCIKRAARPADGAPPTPPGLAHGSLDLRLRATPDQLNVAGSDRLTTGAAQLSYVRERVLLPAGGSRHDNTIGIKGTLGIVIDEQAATREHAASAAYLYASYQLQRLRTTPPPTLAPGVSQRDKDTDVLEVGLTGFRILRHTNTSPVNLLVSGNGSIIMNRVADSERLRVAVTAVPSVDPTRWPIRLCSLGYFRDLGLGLGARCGLTLRLEANHFLDRGTAAPTANDEFVLAGGEAGIEFAQMRHARLLPGGVIAGATYRYERAIHGGVPDIDRFTAFLKYRHWVEDNRFALEFGFNFVDGTNPESFADENRLTFGLGLIF